MCGIIGVINNQQASCPGLSAAVQLLHHRGKDKYGMATETGVEYRSDWNVFIQQVKKKETIPVAHCFVHLLHAVVSTVPQPFHESHGTAGTFLYNGEVFNWKALDKAHGLQARNDAEAVFRLFCKKGVQCLKDLDGVFALAYDDGQSVVLARDCFGERPLWYSQDDTRFAFASEKKALHAMGMSNVISVKPGYVVRYDRKTSQCTTERFTSMSMPPLLCNDKKTIMTMLASLLQKAVARRTDGVERVGILLSGGVDSALLTFLAKQLGKQVSCYTAGYQDGDTKAPDDVEWAKRAAENYGVPLSITIVDDVGVERAFKTVMQVIESTDPMKVGVATTLYLAGQRAASDGIRVMLSGLGSEELFAGYERHRKAADVNKECLAGLRAMHERDLERDDMVMMALTIELRLPFLDRELASYALAIPGELKLTPTNNKVILREAAEQLGLAPEFCRRKKQAAQYGSNIDKAMAKLARKRGFKMKGNYLEWLNGQAQEKVSE